MEGNFLSTAIGSMPFEDPAYAVKVSLKSMDAPIWPQLPRLGLLEQMEIQYSENMPCATIDHEKKRMFFQTDVDYSELFGEFYENYFNADASGDWSFMAISRDFSHGIHAMLDELKTRKEKLPWLKVQTCGPCSATLSLVDENKRAMYYNEEFRDIIIKAMIAKSRWQIQTFKPYADNLICFVDEPIFAGFGSSTYVSVARDDVVAILKEVIDEIHKDDVKVGIHCCGNTEWSILIDAGVDMVNFDAYEFGETISMYPDHVKRQLERGGMLAWGIIPTSVAIREHNVDTLEKKFEEEMDRLASKGIDKELIVSQAVITPACGTGSMELPDAEKVFEMLKQLSARMKEKYKV